MFLNHFIQCKVALNCIGLKHWFCVGTPILSINIVYFLNKYKLVLFVFNFLATCTFLFCCLVTLSLVYSFIINLETLNVQFSNVYVFTILYCTY